MHRLSQRGLSTLVPILPGLLLSASCSGTASPLPGTISNDKPQACPTAIADQPPQKCPRLKNITLSCGGDGVLHTELGGGSGKPLVVNAKLDNGSVFSAVLVIFNCQDGPREAITFGLTYSALLATPGTGPACIGKSKVVYSQFDFGDPHFAVFQGLAQDQLHRELDERALDAFASQLGLARASAARCELWKPMP